MKFTSMLTILFIGLKLGGVIAWNWFWVLSPLIFATILLVVLVLLGFTVSIVHGSKYERKTPRNWR